MKNVLDITVLDYSDIMEAIFKKQLTPLNRRNTFDYTPSVGYHDDNQVKINVGIVFETPTGRDSKIYSYLKIKRREPMDSGTCGWVAFPETVDAVFDTIKSHLATDMLELVYNGTPLKKQLNRIKYFVVSSGSGGLPMFKFNYNDLD